jgi:tetratricopeptide (TPR) repeat protein
VRTQGHSSDNPDAARDARLAAVVRDLAAVLERGEALDDAVLAASYPDLMPELGTRLRLFRLLRSAARRANEEPPAPDAPDEREAQLDQEIAYLREHLPTYTVVERIRFGGQGAVYRAIQKATNRVVAVKVLLDGPLASERQRRRFEREVELTSRLKHPHIVTLFESGTVQRRHYFAMEHVEGVPIDEYVVLNDLPPRAIVALLVKVCRAVAYAHQNGVIHRDLGTSNILVDEQGEPHILDFGLAKDVTASDVGDAFTQTGQVLGTLPFLSPEQAGGFDRRVDTRSDVYALGVVLYRLLADAFPYPIVGDMLSVRAAIIEQDPVPLRRVVHMAGARVRSPAEINGDLEAVVNRALAKEKSRRYQTADALADDLERYLNGDAVLARAGQRGYMVRKILWRYRIAATIGAVVVLATAVSLAAMTVAWVQVTRERDAARRAASLATGLFQEALDVDAAMRGVAGGVAIRADLLERLGTALPELERLLAAGGSTTPEFLRLLEQQADVAAQQNRLADARDVYTALLVRARGALEQRPDDVTTATLLLRAHRKLAPLADDPPAVFAAAVALPVMDLVEKGDDAGAHELAQLHAAWGDWAVRAGYPGEAEQHLRQAAALCLPRAEAATAAPHWLDLAVTIQLQLGRTSIDWGDLAQARGWLEPALAISERLLAAQPGNADARAQYVETALHLSEVLARLGDNDAGLRVARAGYRAAGVLAALDPSVTQWRRNEALLLARVARYLINAGELSEARVLLGRAWHVARETARYGAGTPLEQEMLVRLNSIESSYAMACREPVLALISAERAVVAGRVLVAAQPDYPRYLNVLADALTAAELAAGRTGDALTALAYSLEGLECRQRLLALEPAAGDRALGLAQAYNNAAVACLERGEPWSEAMAAALLARAEQVIEDYTHAGRLHSGDANLVMIRTSITRNRHFVHARVTGSSRSVSRYPSGG